MKISIRRLKEVIHLTIIIKGALNPLLLAAVEFCRLNMKAVGDSYADDDDDYDDDYDDFDAEDYDSDDSTVVINGKRVYVPSSQR